VGPGVVVFDVAGVLLPAGAAIRPLAVELGVPAAELAPAYWAARDDYDRGGPSIEFWARVTRSVGRSLGPDAVTRLDAIDAAGWARTSAEADELLAALARAGVPLALLSNAPATLAARARAAPWSARFGLRLFSCDVGAVKPEAAIYAAAERQLGLTGDAIAFFDDRQPNVDAAARRGWSATRWTGAEDARETLGELLLPPGV